MPFNHAAAVDLLVVPPRDRPVIKGWNRLEGRPRAEDFERALRAEVRDPLWFLTRQWQFGEFRGEDAGSPVEAHVLVNSLPFAHYTPGSGSAVPYEGDVPLEARVEGERIPADLITHIQVSRFFFAQISGVSNFAQIRALYLDPSAYRLTSAAVEGIFDDDMRHIFPLAAARTLDGAKLLAEIESGAHETRVAGFAGLNASERAALVEAGRELLARFRHLYCAPLAPGEESWAPRYLEYRFACSTAADGTAGGTRLVGDQFAQGHLDWFAFDIDAAQAGATPSTPEPRPIPAGEHGLSFVPAPVSFGGMPSHRYWELESGKTEFADIDVNTTDLAKLLLTEFALIYGNDWCVIPYVVPVGTLSEVAGLLVRDAFGEATLIRAAGRGRDASWQRWAVFTLSTNRADGQADQRLLLPPSLTNSMEGEAIERVVFLRDEMANLVWAVERIVPAASGGGIDAYAVARAPASSAAQPARHPTDAQARYALGTDVPENWHPFLPVRVPGNLRSMQLQRARMPGAAREIRGRVLAGPAPYFINEEEVPRAGKVVIRAFQRARWTSGGTFVWLGRRVTTGRGEGSSGLAFDQVLDLKNDEI
jgi:hypothetical protein